MAFSHQTTASKNKPKYVAHSALKSRHTKSRLVSDESRVRPWTEKENTTRTTRRLLKRDVIARTLLWAFLALPILILIFVLRGCT